MVDQCVQGEGMVQINLEVKSQPGVKPKINIVDILKPADEVEAQLAESELKVYKDPPVCLPKAKLLSNSVFDCTVKHFDL